MNLQAKPSFEPKTQNQSIQDNFNEFLKQETFKPLNYNLKLWNSFKALTCSPLNKNFEPLLKLEI